MVKRANRYWAEEISKMSYIRLTDKERAGVKLEWRERIALELGPEPTLRGTCGAYRSSLE
jgi:hypothetical protein